MLDFLWLLIYIMHYILLDLGFACAKKRLKMYTKCAKKMPKNVLKS